jgi:UDP-N-acetylmuramoyl-L-alanyl-D-glutamate--2,6-diaminopimelate ligase
VAKRSLQGEVATRLADFGVFTTEDPRFEDADEIIAQIAAGADAAGGQRGVTFEMVTERRDAIRLACERAQPGDCVLLAGKGHEQSIIWGREKRPWDEATVAREVLTELGYGVAAAT